jgi:hypothetical protein
MSASSLPPELPLNSAPWAEALIGGQAVVGPAGHPQEAPGTDELAAGHCGLPLTSEPIQEEMTMTKIVLALALAFAAFATVPAAAGPYCQEDLGYGRTSSFGCGG